MVHEFLLELDLGFQSFLLCLKTLLVLLLVVVLVLVMLVLVLVATVVAIVGLLTLSESR